MTERAPRPVSQVPTRWLGILVGFAAGQSVAVVVLAVLLMRKLHLCAL